MTSPSGQTDEDEKKDGRVLWRAKAISLSGLLAGADVLLLVEGGIMRAHCTVQHGGHSC